jgi:hypothetical protein
LLLQEQVQKGQVLPGALGKHFCPQSPRETGRGLGESSHRKVTFKKEDRKNTGEWQGSNLLGPFPGKTCSKVLCHSPEKSHSYPATLEMEPVSTVKAPPSILKHFSLLLFCRLISLYGIIVFSCSTNPFGLLHVRPPPMRK